MEKIPVIVGTLRDPPLVTCIFSLPDYSIYVPGSPFNAEVSGDGNPTPGTPVELRVHWNGANQAWRFQPA